MSNAFKFSSVGWLSVVNFHAANPSVPSAPSGLSGVLAAHYREHGLAVIALGCPQRDYLAAVREAAEVGGWIATEGWTTFTGIDPSCILLVFKRDIDAVTLKLRLEVPFLNI